MTEILRKVHNTIKYNDLLFNGESVLVALSGGADSVCLLKILCMFRDEFNIKIYAAHLNHMLRGVDAENDAKFAENVCSELDVPFYLKKVDVLQYAKEHSQSTEEAGRNIRYSFFADLCREYKIDKIATAHNLNDNVETVLMRFIRGTGITGLGGIPYVNGNIIRPILDLTRQEVEQFLNETNTSFVTDKTNFEDIYHRNRIRLSLIPEIENKYNKNFKDTLASNIINYKEASDFLKKTIDDKVNSLIVKKKGYAYLVQDKFNNEHNYVKSSVIYNLIDYMSKTKQCTSKAVREIVTLAKQKNGKIDFSKELSIYIMYNRIYFVKKKEIKDFCYTLENDNNIYIPEIDTTIKFEVVDKKEKCNNSVFLDIDMISGKTIKIRNRKNSDAFIPSGMTGKKKLKDYFIDEKIPVFLRDEIPLILADDEIIAVGILRENEKYKVTDKTKQFFKIEFI